MSPRVLAYSLFVAGCGPVAADEDDDSPQSSSTSGASSSHGHEDEVGTVTADTSTTTATATTASSESSDDGPDADCMSPWPGITMLACGECSSRIADDDERVYTVVDGDLVVVELASGSIDVLVTDSGARTLVLHGGSLYWADFFQGEVGRVQLDSGAVEILATGLAKPFGMDVGDDGIYVGEYDDAGTVRRIPLGGGDSEVLYDGLDHPGPIVLVGSDLYVVDSNDDGNNATPILRGSTDGAMLESVVETGNSANTLLVYGDDLLWSAYALKTSAIRRIGLAPGSRLELLASTDYQPNGLAVTPERAYWTEFGEQGLHNALRSVSLMDGTIEDHATGEWSIEELSATPAGIVLTSRVGLARLDGT